METDKSCVSKAQRTRQALRKAARTAFAEHGWTGTRVSDITTIAQVSHGTFYTYYENREAVLDDLISEVVSPLLDLAAAPWRAQTPYEGLRHLIEAFLDVFSDSSDIITVWYQAASDQPHFDQSWVGVFEAFTNRIVQRLEGLTRVVKAPCDSQAIRDVAQILVAMVAYHHLASPDQQDRERTVDAMMVIWGGAVNHLLGSRVITRPGEH